MRLHIVTATTTDGFLAGTRFAASQAEASKVRLTLMEITGLKKSRIEIAPCEIPTDKAGLINTLNAMFRVYDLQEGPKE